MARAGLVTGDPRRQRLRGLGPVDDRQDDEHDAGDAGDPHEYTAARHLATVGDSAGCIRPGYVFTTRSPIQRQPAGMIGGLRMAEAVAADRIGENRLLNRELSSLEFYARV